MSTTLTPSTPLIPATSEPASHDHMDKRRATIARNKASRRDEKLAEIARQVADGTLVIRHI